MKQINVVIALRGLAALSVALFHIVNAPMGFVEDETVRSIFVRGASGVQVFFIISGLVIPLSLIKSNFQFKLLGRFMLKRTIRIEPTYLAMIALSMAFIAFREVVLNDGGLAFPSLLTLFYNVTYMVPFVGGEWINAVFWTLGVELQYYLLIALIWPLAKSLDARTVLLLPVLGVLGNEIIDGAFVLHWLHFFNVGIILALFRCNKLSTRLFWLAQFATIIGIYWNFSLFYATLASLTLAVVFLFPDRSGGSFLQFLGKQSYSLYLIHGLVGCSAINILMRFVEFSAPWEYFVAVLLALGLSIVAAQLMFWCIERPTMRWSKGIDLQ